MSDKKIVLVVGVGEVGKPLLAILSRHYNTIEIDVKLPVEQIEHADVMQSVAPSRSRIS